MASKIKRNDPCPCGSGKKYKKCHCGIEEVASTEVVMEQELDQLYQQLISLGVGSYQSHVRPSALPDFPKEYSELYTFNYIVKQIMDEPVEGDTTIIDKFYEKKVDTLTRPQTLEAFKMWPGAAPVLLEVKQVDNFVVQGQDLLTDEAYTVKIPDDMSEVVVSDVLLGYLFNWGTHYALIPTPVPFDKRIIENFMDKSFNDDYEANKEENETKSEYFQRHYLRMIETLIQHLETDELSSDNINWSKDSHQQVAELFETYADHNRLGQKVMEATLGFWSYYCKEYNPTIRKPEIFAAALEYHVTTAPELGVKANVTQKEIATKHGVSPNSLSKRKNEIGEAFQTFLQEQQTMV
ncbi:hypothetical protein N781_01940 [Pontibacillus halophilus JSM 076056 = DSM 19796]|uniref:HTH psq-type domain-containing protein n=1 Tax=Pontibacillus halophilus JSM 076056 = DSM 19796 TaxID=1385510 RepID=A0A0A5GSH7_9BACI|nr:SEC-C metal-binding domain-containing protein [Pontibacillus halophilus]KGX94100.1 hypothetical protein N781_01940 [Pontibacillus halophilus JSM 076056 = DSM 19796]